LANLFMISSSFSDLFLNPKPGDITLYSFIIKYLKSRYLKREKHLYHRKE
jgi:hypothetical protein